MTKLHPLLIILLLQLLTWPSTSMSPVVRCHLDLDGSTYHIVNPLNDKIAADLTKLPMEQDSLARHHTLRGKSSHEWVKKTGRESFVRVPGKGSVSAKWVEMHHHKPFAKFVERELSTIGTGNHRAVLFDSSRGMWIKLLRTHAVWIIDEKATSVPGDSRDWQFLTHGYWRQDTLIES